MNSKSSYSDGRQKREVAHHRVRRDTERQSAEANSPVSFVMSDSSLGSQVTISKIGVRLSKSEAKPEGAFFIKAAPLVVPVSPVSHDIPHHDPDYTLEMFKWFSNLRVMRRAPHSLTHLFDIECNDNWDDMADLDCTDLKTPVFD